MKQTMPLCLHWFFHDSHDWKFLRVELKLGRSSSQDADSRVHLLLTLDTSMVVPKMIDTYRLNLYIANLITNIKKQFRLLHLIHASFFCVPLTVPLRFRPQAFDPFVPSACRSRHRKDEVFQIARHSQTSSEQPVACSPFASYGQKDCSDLVFLQQMYL